MAALACGLAGCMGSTGDVSDTGNHSTLTVTPWNRTGNDWLEVHLAWTQGTGQNVTWKGREYATAPGDEWATDGENYLYARNASQDSAHARCLAESPPDLSLTREKPYVWIGKVPGGCLWDVFPGVDCLDASFCQYLTRSAGPPPSS
ncbi:MAG: hypothetical protein QOE90_1895 [Thermoplasmata archaeon]|nr:hypothetical protein [Thermoplasmata archaeon]